VNNDPKNKITLNEVTIKETKMELESLFTFIKSENERNEDDGYILKANENIGIQVCRDGSFICSQFFPDLKMFVETNIFLAGDLPHPLSTGFSTLRDAMLAAVWANECFETQRIANGRN